MKIFKLDKLGDEQKKIATGLKLMFSCEEVSIVENPKGTFLEFDFYPLADKSKTSIKEVVAILTDMDGTTTTTEDLCLHSQEYMLQKVMNNTEFKLDKKADYPNIIGNSTTKHVEYLIGKYSKLFSQSSLKKQALISCKWTSKNSKDPKRVAEAKAAMELLKADSTNILPLCIEIYYCRYHQILGQIKKGNGKKIAKELLDGKPPIAPMAGIAEMLCLVKGLLGNEADRVIEIANINKLGIWFQQKPVKVGLVTSSIFYEADIVLGEVFEIMNSAIEKWDISKSRKMKIIKAFSNYSSFYDAVVTADDSNEIRLKPHRDLYTVALRKMNINNDLLEKVMGFEDSESGLLALRAAGIGKAIAVPFHATSNHNLEAAAVVAQDGIFEFMKKYRFFLKF